MKPNNETPEPTSVDMEESLKAGGEPDKPFRPKRHPVGGRGTQPGVAEGDWEAIRSLVYRV